jgi:hypothetical protein
MVTRATGRGDSISSRLPLRRVLGILGDYDVAHVSPMVCAMGSSPPWGLIACSMLLSLAPGKSGRGTYCYLFRVKRSTNRVRPCFQRRASI